MASLSRRTEAQSSKRAAIEATVLRTTGELLADGMSYSELSIERIATAAGLSRTAFYFYFRDKRELLTRLTADVADELYEEAERWFDATDDGAAELEAAIGRILELYSGHAALMRAVVESAAYDEPVAEYWRALMGRFIDAATRRIEQEQASGKADGMPAADTATALVWMTERTCYQRVVAGHDLADPGMRRALAGIWIRSVYG
jgi:AcrR family transcriptional regulator